MVFVTAYGPILFGLFTLATSEAIIWASGDAPPDPATIPILVGLISSRFIPEWVRASFAER